MRDLGLRATVLSIVAGIFFGVVLFLSFGYVQSASANQPGGNVCPNTGSCPAGYCFTSIPGEKSCKYMGGEPNCTKKCESVPY